MTLKRALEVDLKLCVFCEKLNKPKDDVREATSYSKNVVYEATTKRRKHRDVANREVSIIWKIYLEEITTLVSSGMATVTHSTQVKRKSNVCNKRERQVKNFDLQQQLLTVLVLTVLVKHAVMKKKSAKANAYFAKTKTKRKDYHL